MPTALEATVSLMQSAVAGEAVAAAPSVRLLDQRGRPMAREVVTFEVVAGGGTLSSGDAPAATLSVRTDAAGNAVAEQWRLGDVSGMNEVRARVGGLTPVMFSATGLAGPASQIEAWGWSPASGQVGEVLGATAAVRITDRYGNAVAGVPVVFVAVSGEVSGAASTTGAEGVAAAGAWTLGPLAGEQVLRASAGELAVDLVAVAIPGPAAALAIAAGNGQTATVATVVAAAPTVVVRDGFGNPVGGATVYFEVVAGEGTIGNAQGGVIGANSFTQNADALGTASVTEWTLGTRAGVNRLMAILNGVAGASVTFDAHGVAASPAALRVFDGDNQSAGAGKPVAIPPAVVVTDAHGNPVPNVSVTFQVTGGGGSLTGGGASTNGSGVAAVTAWFLGNAGANILTASVSGLDAVTFHATSTGGTGGSGGSGGPSSGNGYQIEVRFTGSVSGSQQAVFGNAAARWTGAITGDLSSVPISVAAGACGVPHPAVNEIVDDLVIFVSVAPIDGPGKILGSAGPCFIRSGGLPVLGVMYLDAADVSQMEANGALAAVVAHEIGHVLGVGTMWNGLVAGAGSADPYFVGGSAVAAFLSSGSGYTGNPVPVENTGGPGTRDSHWRETVFGSELMTGWINGGAAPLSSVTLASLADLGYAVNPSMASSFSPGGGLSAQDWQDGAALELREGAPLVTPIIVDARGRRMVPVQR